MAGLLKFVNGLDGVEPDLLFWRRR